MKIGDLIAKRDAATDLVTLYKVFEIVGCPIDLKIKGTNIKKKSGKLNEITKLMLNMEHDVYSISIEAGLLSRLFDPLYPKDDISELRNIIDDLVDVSVESIGDDECHFDLSSMNKERSIWLYITKFTFMPEELSKLPALFTPGDHTPIDDPEPLKDSKESIWLTLLDRKFDTSVSVMELKGFTTHTDSEGKIQYIESLDVVPAP